MPAVLIEIRRVCSVADETAIIEAVHAALVSAFRIPPSDRDIRMVVHEPHRFAVSPDLTQPELLTLISIDCFAGRSLQAKRELFNQIGERLDAVGIPPDHVTTILREIAPENWGTRGGVPACDIDLGFDVHV